jgi:hypothetical protein
MSVGVSIGYGPVRPWQQKRRDVVDGLAEIERIYAQGDMSNEPVRRVVEDVFKDCRELADWLHQNSGLTGAWRSSTRIPTFASATDNRAPHPERPRRGHRRHIAHQRRLRRPPCRYIVKGHRRERR